MTKDQFAALLREHREEFYKAGMVCEPMGTDRGHEIERELLAWFPAESPREHPTTDPETAYRTTCNHPPNARGLTGCLLCGATL